MLFEWPGSVKYDTQVGGFTVVLQALPCQPVSFSGESSTVGSCLGMVSGDGVHNRRTFPGVHFPVFAEKESCCVVMQRPLA